MDLSKSYEVFQPENVRQRIHIIGCGSVGSTVAENLVRFGLTNIVLWDFDKVEAHNITNQMFRFKDIGRLKTEALFDMLAEINPDVSNTIKSKNDGWQGETLSGYVFLCVDDIDLRRKIVEKHYSKQCIKAMFDFRTRLVDAQHYAADWSDEKMKKDFLNSMNFSHEEASEETPMSACHIALSIPTTIRLICGYGVLNFINFINKKNLYKLVLQNSDFSVDVF